MALQRSPRGNTCAFFFHTWPHLCFPSSQGLDYVLYGDSIMEAFRGQSVGWDASDRYSGNMQAWSRLAPPK